MITLIHFKPDYAQSYQAAHFDELVQHLGQEGYFWIHFDHNPSLNEAEPIVRHYGLDKEVAHHLSGMEEIYDDDECENSLICKFEGISWNQKADDYEMILFTFLMCKGVLVTAESQNVNFFKGVRDLLLAGKGRFLQKGTGYLTYRLLKDCFVERYLNDFKRYMDRLEVIENNLHDGRLSKQYEELLDIRNEIKLFPEVVIDLENVLEVLDSEESEIIYRAGVQQVQRLTLRRLRDLQDMKNNTKNWLNDLFGQYRNQLSESTNMVMKRLAAISTVFLPITFITSFYGMNFEFMPELHQDWAYPTIIGILVVVGSASLWFMKKKDMM